MQFGSSAEAVAFGSGPKTRRFDSFLPGYMNPKREEAIRLRRNGWSYRKIENHLQVARSTLSYMLRSVPIDLGPPTTRPPIERQLLERECASGSTIQRMSVDTGHTVSAVKYWMKQYGLYSKWSKIRSQPRTHCRVCLRTLSECGRWVKGSRCQTCIQKIRRLRLKIMLVQLLGGKCLKCSWFGPVAGFEFHHPNDDKEFTLGRALQKSWKSVVREAMKCELLCSICHNIEHSRLPTEVMLRELAAYPELSRGLILASLATESVPVFMNRSVAPNGRALD